jgi:DNA end-binding protein Ku
MRPLWKGSITFGLVNIPVSLYPAVHREELSFRMLRDHDLSPINFKRVAEADGKEVPWEHIVKGYEYEKGKFVVLKEEDFKRVDIEAAQSVDILDFVTLADVNPMYFQKPYYLEPQKNGAAAYALLRSVLQETGKAGISKVVIRKRQHLAALRPHENALVLELMHFKDELADPADLKIPAAKTRPGKREQEMARLLVEKMTTEWDPSRYTDDYTTALLELIEKKAKHGRLPALPKTKPASNVIDLVAVLQESLKHTAEGKSAPKSRKSPAGARKKTKAA